MAVVVKKDLPHRTVNLKPMALAYAADSGEFLINFRYNARTMSSMSSCESCKEA